MPQAATATCTLLQARDQSQRMHALLMHASLSSYPLAPSLEGPESQVTWVDGVDLLYGDAAHAPHAHAPRPAQPDKSSKLSGNGRCFKGLVQENDAWHVERAAPSMHTQATRSTCKAAGKAWATRLFLEKTCC